MKSVIVLIALFGVSSANAEWVKVNTDEEGTDYVEISSIRRTTDGIQIWERTLRNKPRKLPSGKEYQMISMLNEYDCVAKRFRNLSKTAYTDRDGKKPLISSETPSSWSFIQPDSNGNKTMTIACKKW